MLVSKPGEGPWNGDGAASLERELAGSEQHLREPHQHRHLPAAAHHHRLRLSTTGHILAVSESQQRTTRIRVARQELGIAKHRTLDSSASTFMRVGSSAARRKPLRDVVESACIRKDATREWAAFWGNTSLTRDRTRQLGHRLKLCPLVAASTTETATVTAFAGAAGLKRSR